MKTMAPPQKSGGFFAFMVGFLALLFAAGVVVNQNFNDHPSPPPVPYSTDTPTITPDITPTPSLS